MSKLKVLIIDLGNIRDELNEPIGIQCLKNSIDLRFKKTVKTDLYWYPMYNNLMDFKILLDYDIVGISININTLSRFESIYNFLKEHKQTNKIIVGGTIPTFGYKELLEKYSDIVVVAGEGENAIVKLISLKLNNNYNPESIKLTENVVINYNNSITPLIKKALNLSNIFAIKRDEKILRFILNNKGIIRVEQSRGCHWNGCTFCSVCEKYGKENNYRRFDLNKILTELEGLSMQTVNYVYFTDEDFLGRGYSYSTKLAVEIINRKKSGKINPELKFSISITADDVASPSGFNAIKKLKEAGLTEVFLGIESFVDPQIRRYNKKANKERNELAIKKITQIGIDLDFGFILLDPFVTIEELKENLDTIKKYNLQESASRCLKRLRLQPLTKITELSKDLIAGDLDIDNLEFPYKFKNDDVALVYQEFIDYEEQHKAKTWELQSKMRSENNPEKQKEYKTLLSEIRIRDFELFENILNKKIIIYNINNCFNKISNFN